MKIDLSTASIRAYRENGELALARLNLVPSSAIDATRTAIALKTMRVDYAGKRNRS